MCLRTCVKRPLNAWNTIEAREKKPTKSKVQIAMVSLLICGAHAASYNCMSRKVLHMARDRTPLCVCFRMGDKFVRFIFGYTGMVNMML